MNLTIQRRQLLLSAFSVSLLGACRGSVDSIDSGELYEITKKILNLPELDPPYTDHVEFDVFYRLCQLVTARIDLDTDVARKIYELNQQEPWGVFHAASIYQIITDYYYDTGRVKSLLSLLQDGKFDKSQEWYLTHLLTTWNVGIYYHDSIADPVRVSFSSSLMWDALEGIVPVPGMSGLEPEYWATNPEIAEFDYHDY